MKKSKLLLIFISIFICIFIQINTTSSASSKVSIKSKIEINGDSRNALPFAGKDTRYGGSIDNLGDINGDGVNDIVVGAYKNRGKGSVYIHFLYKNGTIKKTTRLDSRSINGARFYNGAEYGIKVKNIGDIDGNGVNDIAVKSKDNTYVHYLNNDASIKETKEYVKNIDFSTKQYSKGITVAFIGDIDSNGTNDLLVGTPSNGGNVNIYLLNGKNNFNIQNKEKITITSNKGNYNKETKTSTYQKKEVTYKRATTAYSTKKKIGKMNQAQIHGFVYPDNTHRGLDDALTEDMSVIRAEFHRISDQGKLVLMEEHNWGYGGYSKETIKKLKSTGNDIYTTVSGVRSAVTSFHNNPGQRARTVKSLINFTVNNDITGVDIDIEQFGEWTIEEKKAYISFLKYLGDGLHKKNKKLIVELPAITNDVEASWYKLKYSDFNSQTLSSSVDYYTIMTYDYMFDQGVGTPVQPLDWVGKTIDYAKKHLNNDKIIIGMNSYGYVGIKNGYRPTIITYDQAKKITNFHKAKRDPSSGEMYGNNGQYHFRYIDSIGMNIKKDFIISKGINKISVWHLGGNSWFN